MSSSRPSGFVVLADGCLEVHSAKTATALLRYRSDQVVAVIDQTNQGRTTGDVLGVGLDVPVVATLEQALAEGLRPSAPRPGRLLLGAAPAGGGLPRAWRGVVEQALTRGLDLWSGLHEELASDPQLAALAATHGAHIVDLRAVPPDLTVPSGARDQVRSPVVLTVGSDCNVGKMTVSLEMIAAARARGLDGRFVATGQTGVLLAESGFSVDRVISDFVAGGTERLVAETEGGVVCDLIVVEGQGSLIHPFYSGVTLGLLHGSRPDVMVLCHDAARTTVRHCANLRIPPLPALVSMYEQAAAWVQPAPVVGLALATHRLDERAAAEALTRARGETGLPVEDVIRFPTGELLDACLDAVSQPQSA